jgi:hypothetical protein
VLLAHLELIGLLVVVEVEVDILQEIKADREEAPAALMLEVEMEVL